jgi:hypothetical protein
MNTEIYHCVFTHATDGWSGSGGRFVAVERNAPELPTDAEIELKAFLGKLMPESAAPAWSMRRFAAGADRYACVIASYNGFADAGNRAGVLNHARVVRLERDSIWFDPFPLVALAEDFDIESVKQLDPLDRLQAYLDRIAEEDAVEVRALSRQELITLPRELLREVLTGTLAARADNRGHRRVRAPRGRLAHIARAWAALPVGLQRQSTWAYGAQDGVPVQLIWTGDAERINVDSPSDAVIDCVANYMALLDSSYDLRTLVNDEEINLAPFSSLVQVAAATVASLPETNAMSKKAQKPESRPRPTAGFELEDDAAVELNRQYDRILAAVKEYVDQRLDAYDAGGAGKPAVRPAQSAAVAGVTWKQWLDRNAIPIITALIAGVLLTLGVLFWMGRIGGGTAVRHRPAASVRTETREAAVIPESATETADERPVASPQLRKLIEAAARTGKWKEAFLTFTESEPETVARMIDDTISAPTADANTRASLADLRDRVRGSGNKLDSSDREALRKYLLQYVVSREATADDGVVVDENVSDLTPPLMKAIKSQTNATSSSDKPEDFELQSEVILRWLEMNPS